MENIEINKREKSQKVALNAISFFLAVLLACFIIPAVSAQISFCCEKTNYGAWCANDVQEACDSNFKVSPTACDSTSYCKRGCCFDSQEGLCMENTPERICEDSNGTWSDKADCSIPQCELGCCILGDQASFVTMTRCKAIAGFYGVDAEFSSSITNELTCIATANAKDKGACVFEDSESHSPTCRFTTRGECTGEFHEGILCSAEELGTVCGPSRKTMLLEGRDEVYYMDTCGNPANIYDASKYNDDLYWKKVFTKAESCGAGQSNARSKTCGNCNYFLGSLGKKATLTTGRQTYGEYICADLSCKGHKHGESWCIADKESGEGKDRAGSRYFKQICINGEILVEPCADFRNEICIEVQTKGFTEAACIVNRWQDCTIQHDKDDCENIDIRDCRWIEGYYFASDGASAGIQKSARKDGKSDIKTPSGICVPNYPPGFSFWGQQGSSVTSDKMFGMGVTGKAVEDSEEKDGESSEEKEVKSSEEEAKEKTSIFGTPTDKGTNAGNPVFGTGAVSPETSISPADSCSIGNIGLQVLFKRYEKAFGEKTSWECIGEANTKNGEGICDYFNGGKLMNAEGLANELNKICTSIGDCGGKANYIGEETDDGYALYWRGERVAGAGGAEALEEKKEGTSATGKVIADLVKSIFGKDNKEAKE